MVCASQDSVIPAVTVTVNFSCCGINKVSLQELEEGEDSVEQLKILIDIDTNVEGGEEICRTDYIFNPFSFSCDIDPGYLR